MKKLYSRQKSFHMAPCIILLSSNSITRLLRGKADFIVTGARLLVGLTQICDFANLRQVYFNLLLLIHPNTLITACHTLQLPAEGQRTASKDFNQFSSVLPHSPALLVHGGQGLGQFLFKLNVSAACHRHSKVRPTSKTTHVAPEESFRGRLRCENLQTFRKQRETNKPWRCVQKIKTCQGMSEANSFRLDNWIVYLLQSLFLGRLTHIDPFSELRTGSATSIRSHLSREHAGTNPSPDCTRHGMDVCFNEVSHYTSNTSSI